MSTTVKPLEIYVGDAKVFPDVNTGVLEYPIYGDMYEDTQTLDSIHICNWNYAQNWFVSHTWNNKTMLVMPIIEDTNDSPWHTNSNAEDNYWYFYNSNFDNEIGYLNSFVINIPFIINQNWILNFLGQRGRIGNGAFRNVKATVLNFDTNTSYSNAIAYDAYDHSIKIIDILNCQSMFQDCDNLIEIHGLNLSGAREHLLTTSYSGNHVYVPQIETTKYFDSNDASSTFTDMFNGCKSLTTLDITWPESLSGTSNPVLYGNVYDMFRSCRSLPENQIPTFALRPINQGDVINLESMFSDEDQWDRHLKQITSLHITADSWQYINNIKFAWSSTGISSIDIPATATNLSYINSVLGEYVLYTETPGDYSDNKYIIRTEKPMIDYLNDNDDSHVKLFSFDYFNGNNGFLTTFGGIYVPDSQVTAWQTYISNAGGSSIAQNHVHGLSDL